jgi:hypothetical protein
VPADECGVADGAEEAFEAALAGWRFGQDLQVLVAGSRKAPYG